MNVRYSLFKVVNGVRHYLQAIRYDEMNMPHFVFCQTESDAWLFKRQYAARDTAKYACRFGEKLKMGRIECGQGG